MVELLQLPALRHSGANPRLGAASPVVPGTNLLPPTILVEGVWVIACVRQWGKIKMRQRQESMQMIQWGQRKQMK